MRGRGIPLAFLTALAVLAACDDPADELSGQRQARRPAASPNLDALAEKVPAGPPMMRNISNREYLSAVSALIGEPLSPELTKGWTATTQFSGFDAVPWTNLDAKALMDRADTLELILDKAVASPKVMTCSVSTTEGVFYPACAKSILERFATRAFGRPLSAPEAGALAQSYDRGASLAKTVFIEPGAIFKEGVRAALGSILLSPQFTTRTEAPPTPEATGERDLTSYELASRLSFMFLGSIPDDELWAKAEDGSLATPEVLEEQTTRLLDTQTESFVKGFMGQWLDFRSYDAAASGTIEQEMYAESWKTMEAVVKEDLPVTAILKPGFAFVNQKLAAHYGMPGSFGAELQRVPTEERGGILQQGSWLSLSATPLKTSPMHRGRLVQDRLLCKVIPPPDSALFEQIQAVTASLPKDATVKQKVELHRNAGPACKGCHEFMDPIGIGLEGFDMLGKPRTTYADTGLKVETDSHLLGQPFGTFRELNESLSALPEYDRCVAEKLGVYSLRRIVDTPKADAALVEYLSARAGGAGGKPPSIREMVFRLVGSNAFRKVNHGAKI